MRSDHCWTRHSSCSFVNNPRLVTVPATLQPSTLASATTSLLSATAYSSSVVRMEGAARFRTTTAKLAQVWTCVPSLWHHRTHRLRLPLPSNSATLRATISACLPISTRAWASELSRSTTSSYSSHATLMINETTMLPYLSENDFLRMNEASNTKWRAYTPYHQILKRSKKTKNHKLILFKM